MDATKISATNTQEAVHGKALANAQFKNVVRPNVDTAYSQVWYDLSEEPIFSGLSLTAHPGDIIGVTGPVACGKSAFCTDGISYENRHMNIQKQIFNNDYNKIIKDVLDVSNGSNFYPERFHRYLNYHSNKPSLGIQDVIFRVNLGLDYPFYENTTTIENPYELRVLVNKYNLLPSGFKQYNLVNMKTEYTVNDGKEYLLAGVAYEKYVQMVAKACA
ncbi:MAG: DUF1254 domain-containing protein [Clostridia bacterium]|nr:DUF1254 domain-containing protein [Clostridia bacterium]